MPTPDSRVDAYIANAQPFARPILIYLRETIHAAVPGLEETMKWGSPAYLLDGKQLFHTASFNSHCALSIMIKAMAPLLAADGFNNNSGMGNFGKITSLQDLPNTAQLRRYFKTTAKLSQDPATANTTIIKRKPGLPTPPDLARALKQAEHQAAAKNWANFTVAKQRDYIEWITDAKREATRATRLATTLMWVAEGKSRNWKYEKG